MFVSPMHLQEYSAPQLGEKHTFPMQVFHRIHDRLLQRRVVAAQQLEQPTHMPSRAQLLAVHDANYVEAFLTGTLSQVSVRRIGFGDITRTQTLIRRTLWECAGDECGMHHTCVEHYLHQ
jgi:acetoin utilization deacetylase AcuC-like enzyme